MPDQIAATAAKSSSLTVLVPKCSTSWLADQTRSAGASVVEPVVGSSRRCTAIVTSLTFRATASGFRAGRW